MKFDDYIYDQETYPNCFLFGARHVASGHRYIFEISQRRDDRVHLFNFCDYLRNNHGRGVGFNSLGFDYPILHSILNNIQYITVLDIYNKADKLINGTKEEKRAQMVWQSEWYFAQLDLFKMHHFDFKGKQKPKNDDEEKIGGVSLKSLEFAMRMDSIEDLPYPPGTYLTNEQIDVVRSYMMHDVDATYDFYIKSADDLSFREEIGAEYQRDFSNTSDTNIGKEFFIIKLEEAGIPCYEKISGRRQVRTTPRPEIVLNNLIFPYVQFERKEFNDVLTFIRSKVIKETKGVFKNLTADIDGFKFFFGVGGIHGSVESRHLQSNAQYVLIDDDVESYYPNLAIKGRVYPEHLSPVFCDVYDNLFHYRKQFKKGTGKNKMVKLGLNGTYGNSNSKFSPFYDPNFTMTITLNGQFLLCMLAEQLVKIPGLILVQANTDGITYYVPRVFLPQVNAIREWWMNLTKLTLEQNEYSDMWIRDVNSYIARYASTGELKRKGAYAYGKDLRWEQNFSGQVIAKAAEAALVYGKNINDFITSHEDVHDFMMLARANRNAELFFGEHKVQNTSRYYVSTDGEPITKFLPPTAAQLKKDPNAGKRAVAICKGWTVTECNNMQRFNRATLNYEFYIKEAEKLVAPLR